jgi:hypothetical protein
MKLLKHISYLQAINGVCILLILILCFHGLVFFGIIPYSIVWAGKLNSVEEMKLFESVSIAINVLLLIVFLLKKYVKKNQLIISILNIIIWLFVILFALNTIGNLFAKSRIEQIIFTPLTFISALLCYRIVMKEKD